ncbi:hypothetical protein E2C01_066840 [Portunus trituberculatus]|uniref:Uncharacterized protein n=1 Tax=Portunus trituberculatus TaxID=210409 RepID=A0A5B7HJ96_PORTR|nr:hypothetical protein [Portunus trituberculatus]
MNMKTCHGTKELKLNLTCRIPPYPNLNLTQHEPDLTFLALPSAGYGYEDDHADPTAFLEAIDQLALAFSSRWRGEALGECGIDLEEEEEEVEAIVNHFLLFYHVFFSFPCHFFLFS